MQQAAGSAQTAPQQNGRVCDSFVVLDFEATCDEARPPKPQEIIEFPVVLVDARTLAVVDEFRTFVRPVHHPRLTAFCTDLTGIRQEDVDDAPVWSEALAQVSAWLDDQLAKFGHTRCLFVTCGDWDLAKMILSQCATSGDHVPERFRQWLNIKYLFKRVTGKPACDMPQMLKELSLPLEGRHHSGLDDSRNIAKILATLLLAYPPEIQRDMLSYSRPAIGSTARPAAVRPVSGSTQARPASPTPTASKRAKADHR